MPIPTPEPGLVLSYSYLRLSEYEAGRDEGVKDRPSVIVLTVERAGGATIVTVLPITHSAAFLDWRRACGKTAPRR